MKGTLETFTFHCEWAGDTPEVLFTIPIGSMYGIFTYIYHKNQPNVGKYTLHGSYGIQIGKIVFLNVFQEQQSRRQLVDVAWSLPRQTDMLC